MTHPPLARPPRPSAASQRLAIVLAYPGLEIGKKHGRKGVIAEYLGVRHELVGRWSRGERKPSPEVRAKLEGLLGIDWRLWEMAPTRRKPNAEEVLAAVLAAPADRMRGARAA